MTFASVPVGSQGGSHNITLTANSAVTITNLDASSLSPFILLGDNCSKLIAKNENCTLTIAYAPSKVTTQTDGTTVPDTSTLTIGYTSGVDDGELVLHFTGYPVAGCPTDVASYQRQTSGQAAAGGWAAPLLKASSFITGCFFAASGPFAPVSQVRFQYSLSNNASSLSSDLVTATFPGGMSLAFGAAVTGSGGQGGAQPSGSAGTAGANAAAAIQQMEAGGNYYVRANWPLVYAGTQGKFLSFMTVAEYNLGFASAGLGGSAASTEATQYYMNYGLEHNLQIDAFDNAAAIFVDGKTGLESVSTGFAQSVAWQGGQTRALASLALGVTFAKFISVGFQRYYGDPAAFGASGTSTFKAWHLILQFAPGAAAGH